MAPHRQRRRAGSCRTGIKARNGQLREERTAAAEPLELRRPERNWTRAVSRRLVDSPICTAAEHPNARIAARPDLLGLGRRQDELSERVPLDIEGSPTAEISVRRDEATSLINPSRGATAAGDAAGVVLACGGERVQQPCRRDRRLVFCRPVR